MAEAKGRRSCLGCGCTAMGSLVLLVIIGVGWMLAVQAGVLERLGLREAPVDAILWGAPDRAAAAALEAELVAADLNLQGVSVAVLPIAGGEGELAIFMAEASKGYRVGQSGELRDVFSSLQEIATGDTLDQLGITRVAVDFRGQTDRTVVALTAETRDIQDFAAGRIERVELGVGRQEYILGQVLGHGAGKVPDHPHHGLLVSFDQESEGFGVALQHAFDDFGFVRHIPGV